MTVPAVRQRAVPAVRVVAGTRGGGREAALAGERAAAGERGRAGDVRHQDGRRPPTAPSGPWDNGPARAAPSARGPG
ncbi:hypothetical protein ACWCQV_43120, partial [Streptomyces eurythermus]